MQKQINFVDYNFVVEPEGSATMTNKSSCKKGTKSELSDAVRERPELDSYKFGYSATDMDYLWRNTQTKNSMIIEEKAGINWRNGKLWGIRPHQIESYKMIDAGLKAVSHPQFGYNYHGMFLIQFEKKGPVTGGKIYITKDVLIGNPISIEVTPDEFWLFMKTFKFPEKPRVQIRTIQYRADD